MTTLIAEELKTELIQDCELLLTKNHQIEAIKIFLFCYNASSIVGTFKFSIFDGATEIAAKTFDITDIVSQGSFTSDYFYSWYPVVFDNPIVLQKGAFTFKLSSVGYTYESDIFLAWCREHENEKVPITYVPEGDLQNPLSFEIYARKGEIMTRIVDIIDGFQSNTAPNLLGIGWMLGTTQIVSNGNQIVYDTETTMQYQDVISDGGNVIVSAAPFGTSNLWPANVVVRIKGNSDVDTVTIQHSDIQYGVILNGDITLTHDAIIELQYDPSEERFIEISRNI